jgi:hypothetical protein
MTCIPSFIETGSGVQKSIEVIHRHKDSMEIAHACLIFFKSNKFKINDRPIYMITH